MAALHTANDLAEPLRNSRQRCLSLLIFDPTWGRCAWHVWIPCRASCPCRRILAVLATRQSPLYEFPDFGLQRPCLRADLGVDTDGLFEMGHSFFRATERVQQIGQVAVQRGLAVTVALVHTQSQGRLRELQSALKVPACPGPSHQGIAGHSERRLKGWSRRRVERELDRRGGFQGDREGRPYNVFRWGRFRSNRESCSCNALRILRWRKRDRRRQGQVFFDGLVELRCLLQGRDAKFLVEHLHAFPVLVKGGGALTRPGIQLHKV